MRFNETQSMVHQKWSSLSGMICSIMEGIKASRFNVNLTPSQLGKIIRPLFLQKNRKQMQQNVTESLKLAHLGIRFIFLMNMLRSIQSSFFTSLNL